MTDIKILELSKCYRKYLGGQLGRDMHPIDGYDDKFYAGVLWAFERLADIQPIDGSGVD